MSPAESIPHEPSGNFSMGAFRRKADLRLCVKPDARVADRLHKTSAEQPFRNALKQGGTAINIVPCNNKRRCFYFADPAGSDPEQIPVSIQKGESE